MMNRRQLFQGTAAAAVTLSLGCLVTKSPSVAWKWETHWCNYDFSLATTLELWVDGVRVPQRQGARTLMKYNKRRSSPIVVSRTIEFQKQMLRQWAYDKHGVTDYLV